MKTKKMHLIALLIGGLIVFSSHVAIAQLSHTSGKGKIKTSDYPKKIERKLDTICVQYIAWACVCPNWIETHYYEEGSTYRAEEHDDCIFLERKRGALKIENELDYRWGKSLTLVGAFYKDKGISRNYVQPTSEKPNPARVFRYTNILNDEWTKLNDDLYQNGLGEIGLKTTKVGRRENETVDIYLTKLGDVWDGKEQEDKRKHLVDIVDVASFERSAALTFYKDNHNIYMLYTMRDGGSFDVFKMDRNSFEVIGDHYVKDKNHIYVSRNGLVKTADYETFVSVLGVGPFARDKHGYYYWNTLMMKEELKGMPKKEKEQLDIAYEKKQNSR